MTQEPPSADETTNTAEATGPADEAPRSSRGDAAGRTDKKERVLHTRIPAVLEQELKRFAENLRVPVSNLVRTILEDALVAADAATSHVEGRLRDAATQVAAERDFIREKMRRLDPLEGVLAFQPIVLARATRCLRCGVALEPGANGWLGVTESPGTGPIVCADCIPGRSSSGAKTPNTNQET